MPIDLQTEKTLTLAAAARLMPPGRGGRPCHLSTVFRWITEGAKGPDGRTVRLDAVRLGGKWITSVESLERFAAALTPDLTGQRPRTPMSASRRQAAAQRAGNQLQKMGL